MLKCTETAQTSDIHVGFPNVLVIWRYFVCYRHTSHRNHSKPKPARSQKCVDL